MIEKVNLAQKFNLFNEQWSPKIAGQVNDFHVKIVKLQGEFVWHHHEVEDELFWVIKGRLLIRLRDQPDIELNEGEFVIIPHGVEHLPVAEDECHIVLLEPATTTNTGSAEGARTVQPQEI